MYDSKQNLLNNNFNLDQDQTTLMQSTLFTGKTSLRICKDITKPMAMTPVVGIQRDKGLTLSLIWTLSDASAADGFLKT